MLLRLLLLVALGVAGLFAYRKLRTPPLLRVPRRWDELAKDATSAFSRALRHRQGMATLLLEGKAQHTSLLLGEVDAVLEGMVELHNQRELMVKVTEQHGGKALKTAVEQIDKIDKDLDDKANWLDEAHNHLLSVAAGEYTDTLTRLRTDLHNKGIGFRATLDTYKDLERQLSAPERDLS